MSDTLAHITTHLKTCFCFSMNISDFLDSHVVTVCANAIGLAKKKGGWTQRVNVPHNILEENFTNDMACIEQYS